VFPLLKQQHKKLTRSGTSGASSFCRRRIPMCDDTCRNRIELAALLTLWSTDTHIIWTDSCRRCGFTALN